MKTLFILLVILTFSSCSQIKTNFSLQKEVENCSNSQDDDGDLRIDCDDRDCDEDPACLDCSGGSC